jgi:hypothetical protein
MRNCIRGTEASTEGIASIDFFPLAIDTSNVRLTLIRESIKGVYPSYFPPSRSLLRDPIYSLAKLSMIIMTTLSYVNGLLLSGM